MERIFGLDAQLVFDACVLAVNIFILFIFLSYLLFNPVRDMLKKRAEGITEERETAAKDKEDAKNLKAEYEARLKEVDKEVETILTEARKKALKKEDSIINEAKEEALRIVEQARKEAELEKNKVRDEIKKEIILVSTMMAGKMVKVAIDQETQDRLLDETLREIGGNTWQS